MIRIPFVSRRDGDKEDAPGVSLESRVPAWIDQVPRVGWPVVAVIAMIMCAPGEKHLALMAGYSYRIGGVPLAWGMPACLVAYAGIAASVATRRAKGAPGRRTAILGAFLSLGAAMSAQPVSHMFVTGHWDSSPAPVWIVWTVSVVPPLVVGHLMHMAASHTVSRRRRAVPVSPVPVSPVQDVPSTPVPSWVTEEKARRSVPVPSVSPETGVSRDVTRDKPAVSLTHPGRVPVRPGTASLGDRLSMSSRAVDLLSQGHDETYVRDTLREEFTAEDGTVPKPNSINKAVTRARDKVSRAS